MMSIQTTYHKYELKLRMKYTCICGHKMYRVNSSYYTLSPFNRHSVEACEALNNVRVYTSPRACPKCKHSTIPVLTQEERNKVESWAKVYLADCERLGAPSGIKTGGES